MPEFGVIRPVSDCALSVEFENKISEEIHERVFSFCALLESRRPAGVTEWVPAYRSVLLLYRPETVTFSRLRPVLAELLKECGENNRKPDRITVEIPVLYGGDYGPDLEYVASFHRLTPEEVVKIHSAPAYLVYMLGFTPGFPYLGGMDERIATPRLKEPRTLIPAGSVGIAGGQTGVYPVASPGGWQLIGATPLSLFDPDRAQPFLISAGNLVRFIPVTKPEFDRIRGEAL